MLNIAGAIVALLMIVLGATASAGELRRESISSPALGRDMTFVVYLPEGYQSSGLQYPVLYLLHGAGGDENSWSQYGRIQEQADKLIANGSIPQTLIVMPGCRECWWIDGAKDKAETAFWKDLVPAVASRYRTIEARNGRLFAGLSAGGYGAVRFGLKYPDQIAAVAALSPAIYATSPPEISSARNQPPFMGADGKFDNNVWASLNYPNLVGAYFKQPLRVPFYLASGDGDKYGIAFETALLFKTLFDKQPDMTELRIVDGDHNWVVWASAIEGAMKYLYRFSAPPQPSPTNSSVAPAVVAGRR